MVFCELEAESVLELDFELEIKRRPELLSGLFNL
jgi:hypothetical protein